MDMPKENLISELNERVEFFSAEYARLRTEFVLEDRPTARYRIERNMKDALAQKEAAERAIGVIISSSPDKERQRRSSKITSEKTSTSTLTQEKIVRKDSKSDQDSLLQRPIGYIGITVFAGVLILFVAYLIRQYVGIQI
jgi:hypothetical protein